MGETVPFPTGRSNPPTGNITPAVLHLSLGEEADAVGYPEDDDAMDREFLDAKIETVRAQNDARFAEVLAVSRETAAGIREMESRLEVRIGAIDGSLAAITGRVEGRIDALGGQIDGMMHRLDATSTKGSVWASATATGIALFVAILAALTFATDRFDVGVSSGTAASDAATKIEARLDRLEEIVTESARQVRSLAEPAQVPALPAPEGPARQ